MRTVHLVHFYSAPGGIEVLSSRLLDSFSGYSFRVFVIRPRKEGQTDVYEGTDVPVCYGSRNNPAALFRLWRYALTHRDDIFHLFNLGPYFMMALRLAGVRRIVYSIRGTRYWANSWQRIVRRILWRVALNKKTRIISNSEFSRRVFLEKVCSQAEVGVVYNPVSSSRFDPPATSSSGIVTTAVDGSGAVPPPANGSGAVPPPANGSGVVPPPANGSGVVPPPANGSGVVPPTVMNSSFVSPPANSEPGMMKEPAVMKIVYVGRLNAGKNLEKWIDVAVELHRSLEMTAFEIYGYGPMHETLEARIKNLGAGGYIKLNGFRRDIENVFRGADLLLFLSEHESFGNVVVESILCGTPVIASDIPSMREIFRDYPIFLVSAEGDLSGQILARLNDYDRLAASVTKAGGDFRKRFSEDAYIHSLNEIYSSFYG